MEQVIQIKMSGLNPCFCGIYSQSGDYGAANAGDHGVLILVFVEFTLREYTIKFNRLAGRSLNPCFCGIYSQRRIIPGVGTD